MESVNHIFLHCCYARDVWKEIVNLLEIQWTFQENFVENFLSWSSPFKGKHACILCRILFPTFVGACGKKGMTKSSEILAPPPRSLVKELSET